MTVFWFKNSTNIDIKKRDGSREIKVVGCGINQALFDKYELKMKIIHTKTQNQS